MPITTKGMLWPGIAFGAAVLVELADAGPEHHRERERGPAAGGVHDARTGEVDRAVPRCSDVPRCAIQPPPHIHLP